MEESEKFKFQDLYDRLSLCKNHLSEDYVNLLMAFLEVKRPKTQAEIYKYSICCLIMNKQKINEILQVNNEIVNKLKILMMNFIEEDENYKTVNEVVKFIFPTVFQEKYIQKNGLVNNLSDKEKGFNLSNNSKSENNLNVLQNLINKSPVNMLELRKKEPSVGKEMQSEQNSEQKSEQKSELKSEQKSELKSDLKSDLNSIVSFEQKRIYFQSNSANSLNSLSEVVSSKDLKLIDDIKSKTEGILKQIKDKEKISLFVGCYFSEKYDLFGKTGFFIENAANKIKMLPEDYKLKLLTIYAKLFFLFTEKQKQIILKCFKSEILSDKFFDDNSNNRILNLLFYTTASKALVEKEFILNSFKRFHEAKDIKSEDILKLMEGAKSIEDIRDLFYLYTLNTIHKVLEEDTHYKLLFLLYLHLTKNPFFLRENCFDFLYSLYIIKLFNGSEDSVGDNLLERTADTRQLIYRGINLSTIKSNKVIDYSQLFTKREIKFCEKVLDNIKRFFVFEKKLNLNNLLNSKNNNFKFTMNIVEVCYKKEKIISSKNIKNYRENILKLEESLLVTYSRDMRSRNESEVISEFKTKIYEDKQKTFKEIDEVVQYCREKFQISVTIFPFGSITQFLGSKDSDLDIYMEIQGDTKEKLSFLERLNDQIRKYYGSCNRICSKRLITITFQTNEGVKIDLNYFGVCSVLNSAILRVYSQCDERFVILAHNIKRLLKHLKINNTDDFKVYLNSFSWMILLVTFLQDIVYPPVLPKILNRSNKYCKKIEAGNGERKKKDDNVKKNYKRQKEFRDVIFNTGLREFEINEDFFINEKISEIVENFSKNLDQKNEMGLSELFIKFLEFVIFYFKYDSVFVHASFAGERFMNKSEIKKLETEDRLFLENAKYIMTKQKGDVLIREPFDHTYNPGQTMYGDKTKEFLEVLKSYYFKLILTGDLFA